MKILVPIKRVIDYNVRIHVKADGSGVETANVKMSMNPFCEIAVEEAIRMKEKGLASEIVAVTVCCDKCQDVLRTALAMGVDRAILVETEHDLEPLALAKTLRAIVEKEKPELILTGKQSIDGDNNQTGQMLAALLGWGQGTFVSKIEKTGDGRLNVTREVDDGVETISLKLPCVITTDLRLNEPRYASLPNVMKAKSKPIETIDVKTLGVDVSNRQHILKISEPPKKEGGVKVASVAELLDKLKNEAKVL